MPPPSGDAATSAASITTTELLDGLYESGNRSAWSEFDNRYRPILVGFLRRMGINEADAADVAQETLARFVQDYRARKYDRGKGRLRSWLIGIARCRLADLQRDVGRRAVVHGESAIVGLPDDSDDEALWEAEERRVIFEQAVSELRETTRFNERTIEAFERVVLKHEPVETVAAQTGLSPQEIYNAKNRVVERLREIVKRYEVEPAGVSVTAESGSIRGLGGNYLTRVALAKRWLSPLAVPRLPLAGRAAKA